MGALTDKGVLVNGQDGDKILAINDTSGRYEREPKINIINVTGQPVDLISGGVDLSDITAGTFEQGRLVFSATLKNGGAVKVDVRC